MYRLLIIAVALMLAFAVAAQAAATYPPPANGGYLPGWGMNPTNWQTTTGSYSSFGLYDPLYNLQNGDAWVVGYNGPNNNTPVYITYAPITLELWIEMNCVQTYHYTSYQWHRLGNGADEIVNFAVQGTIQSNNGQCVSLTKSSPTGDNLDKLYFRENIFGGNTPTPAPNLNLTWRGSWGTGLIYGQETRFGPTLLTPGTGDLTMCDIPPCDHWFQFDGSFTIPYHQPDGYYSLTMGGCPAPTL